MREEEAAVRTSVMDKWKKLQGMNQEQAMVKYMTLVKEWQGYGSTLFNVEVSNRNNGILSFDVNYIYEYVDIYVQSCTY